MSHYTNKLILEESPYLKQHAHNPVNWYPWGEEALQKALDENKPILVSIGYAACHWCHVMERESFEDDATASIMNEYFVNIKIDREERPDLDHIYMNAVQTITGSGGWPLNVFLTPQKKPFYGGTYFPPEPVRNLPSWKQVLNGVADAFYNKRNDVNTQAESLTTQLIRSGNFGIDGGLTRLIDQHTVFGSLMQRADKAWGGFGGAPKFPQTFALLYLLQYHHYTNNEEALSHVVKSVEAMVDGGIYDQIGGGFARYATDREWIIPHFEKMLYDNALLVNLLTELYQVTQDGKYAAVIQQTLRFIEREMTDVDGGFYAALDADSEGVEGKFYVWTQKEMALLADDAAIVEAYYNITEEGNWEHGINILYKTTTGFVKAKELADGQGKDLQEVLYKANAALLSARGARVRPALDHKIILGWNAMMVTAYCKAYAALGIPLYKEVAVKQMKFLTDRFSTGQLGWHHVSTAGKLSQPAFLDDYAAVIEALIYTQEVTGNSQYLIEAKVLMEYVIAHFTAEDGYFYYTHQHQADVIFRTKENYDGATASGNAIMAWNLYYLGVIFDEVNWKARGENMVNGLVNTVEQYPTSFGRWAMLALGLKEGTKELVIFGNKYQLLLNDLLKQYLPNKVVQASDREDPMYPLLKGKYSDNKTFIYNCSNYLCKKPVENVAELMDEIRN